jgi:hypothetical protein
MEDFDYLLDIATLRVWEDVEDFLKRCPDAGISSMYHIVEFVDTDMKTKLKKELSKAYKFYTRK